MDNAKINAGLDLLDGAVSAVDFRTHFTEYMDKLNEDGPVIVSIRNKPKAAVIELRAYLVMKEQAEAYQHIKLVEGAEDGEMIEIDILEARITAATANRRAVREAQAA